ncbi:hypothetical protein [Cytobacillus purgationiresistens]|uniref:Lipoprotein n=1 Tax=Cytobacillus purgationiresistens TaxID=863449 RepID=A0ABU0AMA6_9BACI|nr:hypothetical protein [Cytobacillus purgationiresistens]MDQ0272395.1 hypothetical protein [Cytobacillus purgationiresistens]
MKKPFRSVVYLLSLHMLLVGCNKDIPEPETKSKVTPGNEINVIDPISAITVTAKGAQDFFVKHRVDGKDLLIECIVDGVSFRDHAGKNKAKFIVYVDGIKKEEISSAAFKIKDLSSGRHHIKLEIVKDDPSTYFLTKEFIVVIS